MEPPSIAPDNPKKTLSTLQFVENGVQTLQHRAGGDVRKPYPTDVSDEEWAFVAPYLTLFSLDAGRQRRHDLREMFNGLRWVMRTGAPWRLIPHDLPPWALIYQQTRRWIEADCFETMRHDLRMLLRLREGRASRPSSGADAGQKRAGKARQGSDTLGQVLLVHVRPLEGKDREQVEHLVQAVTSVTHRPVDISYFGLGGAGAIPPSAGPGLALEVVKLPEAMRGFVLLPRRWLVEHSYNWVTRFHRLAREYERLPEMFGRLPAQRRLRGVEAVMAAQGIPEHAS